MENTATVVALEGADAWVEAATVDSGCGHCHEAGGCGGSMLSQPLGRRQPRVYRLPNHIGAQVGDRVLLTLPQGSVLQAAILAYLLPLLLIVAGAAWGTARGSDAWAVLGAAVGLGLGMFLMRVLPEHLARGRELLPSMRFETAPGCTQRRAACETSEG